MKFSSVFSIFLAALSVGVGASPLPSNELQDTSQPLSVTPAELDTRNTDALSKRNDKVEESKEYQQFAKIHKDLKKDEYYAFSVKWTYGTAPGDDTPQKEMQKVQKEYGFDHIALVIGKVTERETGKGKNKKTTRKFDAQMHHLKTYDGLKTEYVHPNWSHRDDQDGNEKVKIEFVKQTTQKKLDSAQKKGKLFALFPLFLFTSLLCA